VRGIHQHQHTRTADDVSDPVRDPPSRIIYIYITSSCIEMLLAPVNFKLNIVDITASFI